MLGRILSWLTGGVADRLLDAYRAKLEAQNDGERIAAERTIARLEAQRDLAVTEAGHFWSATRLGRLLFVIPLGFWFGVGVLDSVFLWESVTAEKLPPQLWSIAEIIIPALFLSETVQLGVRHFRK